MLQARRAAAQRALVATRRGVNTRAHFGRAVFARLRPRQRGANRCSGCRSRSSGWYLQGEMKPHVSATYPLEHAVEALRSVVSRKSTGKLVISVGE